MACVHLHSCMMTWHESQCWKWRRQQQWRVNINQYPFSHCEEDDTIKRKHRFQNHSNLLIMIAMSPARKFYSLLSCHHTWAATTLCLSSPWALQAAENGRKKLGTIGDKILQVEQRRRVTRAVSPSLAPAFVMQISSLFDLIRLRDWYCSVYWFLHPKHLSLLWFCLECVLVCFR